MHLSEELKREFVFLRGFQVGKTASAFIIELQKVIRSVQEKWYSLGTSRSSLPAIKNPHSENPYLPFQDTSKANQVIKLNMENVS